MSVISAGTTTTTAFKVTGDTTGTLQLQTGAVPTTAIDISATQVVTFPATTTLNFTGTLLLGDGSAAAPTLAHSGDTNTGIYFPGADQVAITTAGTQRFVVSAAGNVGIGTATPTTVLNYTFATINGSTGAGISLLNSNSDAAWIYATSAGLSISTETASPILFKINAATRATLDASGNLGLGVTPSGWTYFKPLQAVRSGFLGSAGQTGVSYNAYYDGAWKYIANDYALWYSQNATSGQHIWNTAASGTAGNAITFTQAMTLDSNGNLGVGSTAPTNSGGYKTLSLSGSTGGQITFQQSNADKAFIYHDATNFNIYNGVSGPLVFWTNSTERARITNTGGFALGTTTDPGAGNMIVGGLSNTIYGYATTGSRSYIEMYNASTGDMSLGVTFGTASIKFATGSSNTERARITAGGVLCLNTATADACLLQAKQYSGSPILFRMETVDSGTQTAIQFVKTSGGTAEVGTITMTTTATAYNTASDIRLKKNIVNAPDSGADVDALQVRSFDWKTDDSSVKYGFVAQELVTVAPESVKVGDNGDEIETVWGVDYSKLVPMLVKELQSVRARLAALESK